MKSVCLWAHKDKIPAHHIVGFDLLFGLKFLPLPDLIAQCVCDSGEICYVLNRDVPKLRFGKECNFYVLWAFLPFAFLIAQSVCKSEEICRVK